MAETRMLVPLLSSCSQASVRAEMQRLRTIYDQRLQEIEDIIATNSEQHVPNVVRAFAKAKAEAHGELLDDEMPLENGDGAVEV